MVVETNVDGLTNFKAEQSVYRRCLPFADGPTDIGAAQNNIRINYPRDVPRPRSVWAVDRIGCFTAPAASPSPTSRHSSYSTVWGHSTFSSELSPVLRFDSRTRAACRLDGRRRHRMCHSPTTGYSAWNTAIPISAMPRITALRHRSSRRHRARFYRLCQCYRVASSDRKPGPGQGQLQVRLVGSGCRSSPNTKIEARTSTFGRTRTRPSRPGSFVVSHRIGTCAKARQAGIKSSLASPLYLFLEAGTLRGNVSAAWNESAIKTAMQRPAMDARHVSSCGGSSARSRRDAWKHAKNPLRVSTLCPFVRHF